MSRMDKLIGELKEKRGKFLQMGGSEKVARQHNKGWLTARERINRLLDPGSFVEMGLFAHSNFPGRKTQPQQTGSYVVTGTSVVVGWP